MSMNHYITVYSIILIGSAETKLMTLLTCLRVAKTACKDFKMEEKFSAVLINAMHHGDEQVGDVCCV